MRLLISNAACITCEFQFNHSFYLTGSGTKQAAHRLKILFGLAGFKAAELHGNLTQVQRLDVSDCMLM